MEPTDTDAASTPNDKAVILYDGVCGLCHRSVQFLLKRSPDSVLHFATLQGKTASALRGTYPAIPDTLDSVVLVDKGRVYFRSKAFFYVSRHLTYPWRAAWFFRWIPGLVLDPFYWVIAKLRYRLFGRYNACQIPTPEQRARFMD